MKRDSKLRYNGYIGRCCPLFKWRQCCKCGYEFRREIGWQFINGPFFNGAGKWYYICKDCAPTEKDAIKIAVNLPSRPQHKPIAPPPTPIPSKCTKETQSDKI